MEFTKQWKIAGATAAVAALGLGGMLGTAAGDSGTSPIESISLRDTAAVTDTAPPTPVDTLLDDGAASVDGESFDSPLQSADDSPEGADSVDTPGGSPAGESVDSPAASADDSIDGQDSLDSPGGSPTGESLDSPAASADDSIDGQDSVDSPDDVVAPAPAPTAAPAPAPAPAPASAFDSAGGSFDSAGGSFDSPS